MTDARGSTVLLAGGLQVAGIHSMDRGSLLALGFGTTVVMWAVGYICRMPPVWVPSWMLLLLLLACLLAGGYTAGRLTSGGIAGGARVGGLSSLLNILILGSLLGGEEANQLTSSALWWIPGSILAGALLGGLGGSIGATARARAEAQGREPARVGWTAAFAAVAAFATFCLLVIGGIVTSKAAGLAVVDWPNSFGYSMFLYPLSRMTGGIYFEHAHRLFGSLVGLTTLVLAIHLFRVESRRWVAWFALVALVLVIVQGLLGGLRVTGHFTSAMSPEETRPNLLLAIVHGVLGQLFFGMIVALAAFSSRTWRGTHPASTLRSASADYGLTTVLVIALIVQLVLGAIQRHMATGLMIHITMAMAVLLIAVAAGARAAGMGHGQAILRRLGRILLLGVGSQIVLGILALVATGLAADSPEPPAYEVAATTAHQALGAALLGTAVLLAVWSRRLLRAEA